MGAGASTRCEYATAEEAIAAGKTQEEVDAWIAANPPAASTEADCKAVAAQHKDALQALFDKIDTSGDGKLQVSEFKGVVEECSGDIDEANFMGWYDTNGTANGTLDFDEFGWYMADTAWNLEPSIEGASGKLPGVIDFFDGEQDALQAQAT